MNKNLNKYVIFSDSSVIDALDQIDKNQKRFLICLDSSHHVVGTITDGDIRRFILNNLDLKDERVVNICFKEFQYLNIDATFDDICNLFKSHKIDFLPIINSDNILVNIITKKQFHSLLLYDYEWDLSFDFTQINEHELDYEIYNRPWGFYKSTLLSEFVQSKIITVFPNEELSLQEHKRREEHWIIIKGKGKIILGESEIDIFPGKYIYIPKGCKHQIINNGNENIIFSEVQLGDYFGEDDIIRYRDKYGREK